MRTLSAWDKRRLKETARIKALVYEAGLTFSDIDRLHGLRPGAARDILREPNRRIERAVAAALGARPETLWQTRYHADGRRRRQQDYSRPPTMEQRRKFNGAST